MTQPFRVLPRLTDRNRDFWTGGAQGVIPREGHDDRLAVGMTRNAEPEDGLPERALHLSHEEDDVRPSRHLRHEALDARTRLVQQRGMFWRQ